MARDYKYRAHKKPRQKPKGGWLWLVTGYLLGAFTVGLVWLKFDTPDGMAESWIGDRPASPRGNEPRAAAQPAEPPAPPKPRFDFYTLLPEMEVVVPAEEIEELEAAKAPATTATERVSPAAGFLLQVGSFRNPTDAERLKARLALLGLEARVHRVAGSDGKAWHRVRCGPYTSTDQLRDVRKRLSENGLSTLVIRLPAGG